MRCVCGYTVYKALCVWLITTGYTVYNALCVCLYSVQSAVCGYTVYKARYTLRVYNVVTAVYRLHQRVCIYAYICVYMRIYAYICVYMCIYAYICVYMRTYAYICVYIHIREGDEGDEGRRYDCRITRETRGDRFPVE